ncbi:MAG: hypothetical protein HY645_12850 [Acidobacteria bacterium]|nr:hypothetical protein [Acidobacteriota bacterium]
MQVLAFVSDLFFQAKIAETARQLGVDVRFMASWPKEFQDLDAPSLVIVDLNLSSSDPLSTVELARAEFPAVPVVVFGSHIEKSLLQRAAETGASVLPRSRFTQLLPSLLAQKSGC